VEPPNPQLVPLHFFAVRVSLRVLKSTEDVEEPVAPVEEPVAAVEREPELPIDRTLNFFSTGRARRGLVVWWWWW